MATYFKYILIAFLCNIYVVNTNATPIVGQIDGLGSCLPEAYTLTRNNQTLPIQIFTKLQNGDQIAISKRSLIEFQPSNIKVNYTNSPYEVIAKSPITNVEFICLPETYVITRHGKRLPLKSLTELQKGEQIAIDPKKHLVRFQLINKQIVEVNRNKPFHKVKLAGKVPTVEGNLVNWVGQFLTRLHKKTHRKAVVTLSTRGGGEDKSEISVMYITLPEYRKQVMQLSIGTRPLHFSWEGGKSPYRLIIKYNNNEFVTLTDIQNQRVKTQALSLKKGKYQLTISDAQQQTAKYTFIVGDAQLSYPQIVTISELPESTRLTLQATWLAAQEKGKWAFEAYQQIAGIAENYLPARLLRDALEESVRIKAPKQPSN
jgi:hypothetical protein